MTTAIEQAVHRFHTDPEFHEQVYRVFMIMKRSKAGKLSHDETVSIVVAASLALDMKEER